MDEQLIILIILLFLGVLMLILGCLLKFKQKITMIAGIKKPEEQILDKEKFTSIVGIGVILCGLMLTAMGLLRYFIYDRRVLIETIGLTIILLTSIFTFLPARKYIKKN